MIRITRTLTSLPPTLVVLLALLAAVVVRRGSLLTTVDAVRSLRIVSPLQSLTIWDREALGDVDDDDEAADGQSDAPTATAPKAPLAPTHRSRFLPKFRAGLAAEAQARKAVEAQRRKKQRQVQITEGGASNAKNWAQQAADADAGIRDDEEREIEKAYDEGVRKVEEAKAALAAAKKKKRNQNSYQFVGAINIVGGSGADAKPPITWYARKKPADANWSVRLVHVNRDAIIKDLYDRRKIDIFARYDNTGNVHDGVPDGRENQQQSPKQNQPIVTADYTVRDRSWK